MAGFSASGFSGNGATQTILQVGITGNIINGDGQFDMRVEVPRSGVIWNEAAITLVQAGTTLGVQLEEFNTSDVSQGDVFSSAQAMGTNKRLVVAAADIDRKTPDKGNFYKINITGKNGTPLELLVQFRE